MSRTILSKIMADIFYRSMEARIDVKNMGDDGNDLLVNVSDKRCSIIKPDWFSKGGIGYSLRSTAGKLRFSIVFIKSGTFKLYLHTEPLYTSDGNKTKIPVWLDYDKLSINGETIFHKKIETWHNKFFLWEKNVQDGEEMTIEVAWSPHVGEREVFEGMLQNLFDCSLTKLLPTPSTHLDCFNEQIDISKITFSVFGNCVSRDAVEILGVHVNRFIQDISPISAGYASPLKKNFKLTKENVAGYLLNPQLNNFHIRNTLLDMNKNIYQYLFEVKSDWLVLDVGCLRFKTLISKKGNAAVTEFLSNRLKGVLDKEEFDSITVMEMDDEAFSRCMDKYISTILEEYDENKIIVLEEYLVAEYVDLDGLGIHKFNYDIKERNDGIERGYNYLKEKLKYAHFIPFLPNALGDERHKWGRDPLHYVKYCYEYSSQAMKIITCQLKREEENNMIEKLRDYFRHKIEIEYLYFAMR